MTPTRICGTTGSTTASSAGRRPYASGAQSRFGTDRAAWAAIGLGITLFWLGDLYWNNYLADLQTPPYPSWADAGWLAYYVPLYVGLMSILHRRVAGLPFSMWLEGVVGALALASVCATVVF